MTSKEFYDNVAEMRKWQKKFFAAKSYDPNKNMYLKQSKHYENIIDEEIMRVSRLLQEKQEPKLF